MDYKEIDLKALKISRDFKKCEIDLLEIITQVDQFKVYYKFGFNSLFQYAVKRLELSEAQAYSFINVSRKSKEVPQIMKYIKEGKLSVSKAKRVTSVITTQDQDRWLKLAATATQKKVEREVALVKPTLSILERMTYQSKLETQSEKIQIKKDSARVKMEVGISEKLMIKLRRVQDIVSQKKRMSTNLEITLETLVDEYIKKYDPIEKAKRQKIRGKINTNPKSSQPKEIKVFNLKRELSLRRVKVKFNRKPLSASTKYQVYLENNGLCSYINDDGKICSSKRFLEIHHIKPVSEGGCDSKENLTLLCSGHHKSIHFEF